MPLTKLQHTISNLILTLNSLRLAVTRKKDKIIPTRRIPPKIKRPTQQTHTTLLIHQNKIRKMRRIQISKPLRLQLLNQKPRSNLTHQTQTRQTSNQNRLLKLNSQPLLNISLLQADPHSRFKATRYRKYLSSGENFAGCGTCTLPPQEGQKSVCNVYRPHATHFLNNQTIPTSPF